jgi:hypothetical protein
LWWVMASSLVDRLLDNAGVDPFALLIGGRSVVELRQDGTLRRTGLRSLLRGGTTTVGLIRTGPGEPLPDGYDEATTLRNWNDQSMGMVGFNRGKAGQHWRFLDGNEYYLTQAAPKIRAAVIVDTSESLSLGSYKALEDRRLYDDNAVLVLPHTHRTDMLVRGYVHWLQAGRPMDAKYRAAVTSGWDPAAPPNPIRYTCPVPIQATFGVTGLAQRGEWQDPSDLEAARALLEARYDLRLGIWDLVGNPTLRSTLLESVPPTRSPRKAVKVPSQAAARASQRVANKIKQTEAESSALAVISQRLNALREIGWAPARSGTFRLSLTEPLSTWPGSDPFPLVSLALNIAKRQASVEAFTGMYNQVNIRDYVRARRKPLERIAAPEACELDTKLRPVLWRAPGGWADAVDWEQRAVALAAKTESWIKEFETLCNECLQIVRQRFASESRS